MTPLEQARSLATISIFADAQRSSSLGKAATTSYDARLFGNHVEAMKNVLAIIALVLLQTTLAAQTDYPYLKDGFYSLHSQTISQPGNKKQEGSFSVCLSRAHSETVRAKSKERMQKICSINNEHVSGTTITTETECKVMNTTIKTTGKTTISGDTAHSESHTTYSPPMEGQSEEVMTVDEKYVGSCPAGMQPGDRMLKDGSIQHLGQITGQ